MIKQAGLCLHNISKWMPRIPSYLGGIVLKSLDPCALRLNDAIEVAQALSIAPLLYTRRPVIKSFWELCLIRLIFTPCFKS